jgi:WD40 repeat protein
MEFSSDDSILATACGDQTSRLIDMRTQQTTAVLSNHVSSVKQVRFQPGDENVLATCGRDGIVNLWDLRCSHDKRMVMDITYPTDGSFVQANQIQSQHTAGFYTDPLIPIRKAHMDRQALTDMNNNGSRYVPDLI